MGLGWRQLGDAAELEFDAARRVFLRLAAALAGPIGKLNGEGRAALERAVAAGWAGWATDGGLVYGQPILTASART